jgi:alpha-aminoadipate carrier protein LysW
LVILKKVNEKMTECPQCGSKPNLSKDIEEGEIISCGECGTELVVTSLSPVKLDLAPQEAEDWGE